MDDSYLRHTTQAESISNPRAFGYEPWPVHRFTSTQNQIPLPEVQQEPTTPSSGYFAFLTPSESPSTGFSDCVVVHPGRGQEDSSLDESESFSDLAQQRAYSAEPLTPSPSWTPNDASSSSGSIHHESALHVGSKERLPRLPEFNDHNQLDIHNVDVEYVEDSHAYNPAWLGQGASQIRALSIYATNQSRKEAPPWNVFVLQHEEIHIIPENINDKDLSFPFEQCFAPTSRLSPTEGLSDLNVELVNPSPAKRCHPSPKKPQNGDRVQSAQHVTRSNPRGGRRAARRPALSPVATKGRRLEGSHLPEEDRRSAKEVREKGACFRCWLLKGKCTPGESPCETCRRLAENHKFRHWQTPCSSKRLEERCEYLLPAPLVSQISLSEMRALLNQHIGQYPQIFLLSLSIGFGEPWTFRAVELDPGKDTGHDMLGFQRQSAETLRLTNPPVVPLWVDPLLMHVNIDCWLDRMVSNPQADWPHHWFPAPGQIWQLRILEGICQQYHCLHPPSDKVEAPAYQTLRWALKLSVLSYVMSHAFLVPGDKTGTLFEHLRNPNFRGRAPCGLVCPGLANKFLKMMVLPMMRLVTAKTLSGLHELLRATAAGADMWDIWDKAFAVTILCLMAIGSTQRSLLQRAIACATNNDSSFGPHDAFSDAQSMDSELVVYVIGMFHDKFHTSSKSKNWNPFSESCIKPCSTFAKYVEQMTYTLYCRQPFRDDFGNFGAERLLAKFMEPFFPKQ